MSPEELKALQADIKRKLRKQSGGAPKENSVKALSKKHGESLKKYRALKRSAAKHFLNVVEDLRSAKLIEADLDPKLLGTSCMLNKGADWRDAEVLVSKVNKFVIENGGFDDAITTLKKIRIQRGPIDRTDMVQAPKLVGPFEATAWVPKSDVCPITGYVRGHAPPTHQ